jgi:hypothetical protein
MKEQEPKPTIIDQLNKSMKDEALEDMDSPTVQSIAESLGINEGTLYDWLYSDQQFGRDLHKIKEAREKLDKDFPELKFSDENSVGLVL